MSNYIMVKLRNGKDPYVRVRENEYFDLLQSDIMLKALRKAGVEKLDIFKAAQSIIQNERTEIHLTPVKKRYK